MINQHNIFYQRNYLEIMKGPESILSLRILHIYIYISYINIYIYMYMYIYTIDNIYNTSNIIIYIIYIYILYIIHVQLYMTVRFISTLFLFL